MKKTLKSMLAFAVVALCSTSAWAAELVGSTQYTNNGYQYKIKSIDTAKKTGTASVSQSNWATGNADVTKIVIEPTITLNVKGEVSAVPFEGVVVFKIEEIEDGAFAGLSGVTSIEFKTGCNITTIGKGAFAGTHIANLDLSNTKLINAENMFGTSVKAADVQVSDPTSYGTWIPSTLGADPAASVSSEYPTSVSFPATLQTIGTGAFANCTALETVTFNGYPTTPMVYQTIGAYAFYNTAIVNMDMTSTSVQTLNPLFETYNVDLKKVTLPATITTLGAYALADQIQLGKGDDAGIVFATAQYADRDQKYNCLTTIGKYALSNTVVKTLDFSNCAKLVDLSTAGAPILVNEGTKKNRNLTKVILPQEFSKGATKFRPLTTIGIAFANCRDLATIENLEISSLVAVGNYAFANDEALTSLSFPATLKTMNGSPFAGCTALETLNIDATALITLGDGNELFAAINQADATTAWNGVFASAPTAAAVKDVLATLNITGDFSGTIKTGVLAAQENITTVTLSTGNKPTAGNPPYEVKGKIEADAIKLSNTANSSLTLGKINAATIAAGAFVGPTVATYSAALTIGEVASVLSNAIVSGRVGTATVGKILEGVDFEVQAFGDAENIVFNGDILGSVVNTAFYVNNALKTVTFNGKIATTGAVKAGTFAQQSAAKIVAPNLTTVTWKPADIDAVAAFAAGVFADAPVGEANAKVTFKSTPAVVDLPAYARAEANFYNVIFDAAESAPVEGTAIKVVSTGKTYAYGYYKAAAKVYISNKNAEDEDAEVKVYSAYVDEDNIYMDPLAQKDGKFIIAAGQTVVVRSKGTKSVKAYPADPADQPTMRYYTEDGVAYNILNDLQTSAFVFSSDYIGDLYDAKKLIYTMGNPATQGGLVFVYIAKDGYLPKDRPYVIKEFTGDEVMEARLNVIFLDEDGNEDATFINGIEVENNNTVKAGNGKTVNMQGIEVNGSYKGFVIKNGKKI